MVVRRALSYLPIGALIILVNALILRYVNYKYPIVGHDYFYLLSRMVDARLHYLVNGLSVQWYTPSFGGGLPAFGNPISTQFSLQVLMTFFFDFWTAAEATIVISCSIGVMFLYLTLRNNLKLDVFSSLLGSLFYGLNGFSLNHLMAGHLTYHLFFFLPPLLYIFSLPDIRPVWIFLFTGGLYALFVHSTGTEVIISVSLSFLICLFFCERLGLRGKTGWRRMTAFFFGLILAAGISAAKLCAVFSFMSYFPRIATAPASPSFISGLLGICAQLLGYPVFSIYGMNAAEMQQQLYALNGNFWGLWEHDVFLATPLFLILAFFLVAAAVQSDLRKTCVLWFKRRRFYVAAGFLLLWFCVDWIESQGLFYSLIHHLPVIKSMHVNIRLTSVFVVPLCMAGALAYASLTQRYLRNKAGSAALAFVVAGASLAIYTQYENRSREDGSLQLFNVSGLHELSEAIDRGERFAPVENIENIPDPSVFISKASNLRPYEPIFGFDLKTLKSEVEPGKTNAVKDGKFNMTNPASLVYPKENGLHLFERISADDAENFRLFVSRKQPHWKMSKIQNISNWISLLSLLGAFAIALGLCNNALRDVLRGRHLEGR